ncbi:MAG: UDP-N-acetylmuramate dehydrogenase [Candidatus Nanopelagicaceae bacterium]
MSVNLSSHTTFKVGGPASEFFIATDENEAIKFVSEADQKSIPVLILGGGSNILVADSGFSGRVVKMAMTGDSRAIDSCSGAMITIGAGRDWDEFVKECVDKGFVGLESLSGIPGTIGAAPIQNIGAYGHDLSEVVARVRTFDRIAKEVVTFTQSECGFTYRSSRFKENPDRYLILDVTFQMKEGEFSLPILYPELAEALDLQEEESAPLSKVREAVIAIRAKKGMVLDSNDPDTNSAGSFFTNPVVDRNEVPDGATSWPSDNGRVKISAAWLMENAGISKGMKLAGASISSKHVLALTNTGNASASEIKALADYCQIKVRERFGIELEREVRLFGFAQ